VRRASLVREDAVPDRLAELETKYADVADQLRRLEGRIAALERAPAAAGARRRAAGAPPAARARSDMAAVLSGVSFVGRLLLILAGGFVLRALTDAGTLPASVGVALGLAYAGTWIAFADAAGRAGAATSAGYHGAAAVLVGFPLLFEAASRFRLLSPAAAAVLLTVLGATALAVAARRRLEALAWIVTVGWIATAVALGAASGRLGPPALTLVLLGVATLWMSYVLDWFSLRWPAAVAADLAVGVLAIRVGTGRGAEGAVVAFSLQLVLMALYLGSVAARTLLLRREVLPFEVGQTVAAITAGLGGAAFVAVRSGSGASALGAATTALGLAAYGVAFAFLDRDGEHRRNFTFYASAALLLVLAGTGLLLSGEALPIAWASLGVVAAALGRRLRRGSLAAHASAYAVASAIASGLVSHALQALVASPAIAWSPAPRAALPVLAALAAVAWLGAGAATRTGAARVPRIALLGVLAFAATGVAIGWTVPAMAGVPGHGAAAGEVATVRTALLVAATLLLAWLGRQGGWADAGALAYPALAAAGVKLLLEDVLRSRPATLFVAFACYGIALILVPRLRGRRAATSTARA
jgi:hypothetical protein